MTQVEPGSADCKLICHQRESGAGFSDSESELESGLIASRYTYMALAPDVPPLRKVAIKAGKEDTVLALAKRYRVSASQLVQWNRIDGGTRFKKAQSLVIWQPIKEAGASRRKTAALNKADRNLSRKAGDKSAKASTRMASMAAVKGTKIRPIRLARK